MKKRLMPGVKLTLLAGLLTVCDPFAIAPKLNAALITQSAGGTLRVDDGAKQLSQEEIVALEMLVPGTKTPWLLMRDFDAALTATMIAFLPPDSQTSELRRGSMVTFRRLPNTSSDSKPWAVIEANGAYAQVAVPGRGFDQILGDQDINRPFSVIGTFDDAELLSVVRYYRTRSPRIAIRAIERDSLGHVLVSIATEPIRIVLGKQDQGWVTLLKEPIGQRQSSTARKPPSPMDKFAPPEAILNHVETVPR